MNKVFGLLRRSDSVTPTNVDKKADIPLVDDKLKDEDVPLPFRDSGRAGGGKFLLDSGAPTHVCGNLSQFITRQQLHRLKFIALVVANCTVDVTFKGTIEIPTNFNHQPLKHYSASFPSSSSSNYGIIHHIAGPFPNNITGRKYVLTLRNHASTYIWIGILETRADAPGKILEWIHHLKNTLGLVPKCLRSDNAPEYTGTLKKALNNIGVEFAPVTPYSPEQNGKARHFNRTIRDMARTMLHESKMPQDFWSCAYRVASYIHNRTPKSRVDTAQSQSVRCASRPSEVISIGSKSPCFDSKRKLFKAQ
ncbi:hypothetical protein MJO28_017095 [Puccinia striiformis f. sp. tritici]|nr:hypothetical protein MJO28_017095 [Puccinia striiformis f. sp. tritici]KAI7964412.1 hypothetical protein MJO29_002510 [Puccinia striiformis f. sp. tritici]